MHPHLLQLVSARKLLQSCLMAPGPSAHALRLTRLSAHRQRPPHMHLTGLPARPACSAWANWQHSTQQAARQPRLPLSCRRTHAPPRVVAATAPQPASHAFRLLLRRPMVPPPLAARPCRLCVLRQVGPKPISSATSRPHDCRAATAQGALCARHLRTMCTLGLSPARARRAGRLPASLCAQHWRGARPPRRWRCARARRTPTRVPPHAVQRRAPARRALPGAPAACPAAPPTPAGRPCCARPCRLQCARPRRRAPEPPAQRAAACPAP